MKALLEGREGQDDMLEHDEHEAGPVACPLGANCPRDWFDRVCPNVHPGDDVDVEEEPSASERVRQAEAAYDDDPLCGPYGY